MTPRLSILVAPLVMLGLLGLAAIGMAAAQVDGLDSVALQMPYLVSGAVTGLALLGLALAMLQIQHRRCTELRWRAEVDRVISAASKLGRHPSP